MTKKELVQKLKEKKIPRDFYALDGGLPNEALCLNYDRKRNTWEVYYSERGQKTGLKSFDREEEACDYFYITFINILQDMGLYKDNEVVK